MRCVRKKWGEGKRTSWLTSFTLACINEDGEFVEIGKVGTGIRELTGDGSGVTFDQLTKILKPHITAETGKSARISPSIVLEIAYEEIQKSPTYSSGYALRFPRLVSLRPDRNPDACSTLEYVEQLYFSQNK